MCDNKISGRGTQQWKGMRNISVHVVSNTENAEQMQYIAYAYGYDCALGSDACSFEA